MSIQVRSHTSLAVLLSRLFVGLETETETLDFRSSGLETETKFLDKMNSSALESRDQGLEITILVTCDVSNVQSSNGFATCFRLVCDPLAPSRKSAVA